MKSLKTSLGLFVLCLLLISFVYGQGDNWQIIGDMPFPVSNGRAVVKDSCIYILGGYSDSLMYNSKLIQKYCPATNQWTVENLMVEARAGFVAGLYTASGTGSRKLIYCCGALQPPIPPNLFSIEEWDFQNNPSIINYNNTFDRIGTTGLVYNDNLYLFGGYKSLNNDTLFLDYIIEYNIPTVTVTYRFFNSPFLPFNQMSALIGDDIYIFGGELYGVSTNIFRFNTLAYSYEQLSTCLPSPRAGGAAVAVSDSMIYIIGGYSETQWAMDSVCIFTINPVGNFINTAPNLNVPRNNLMAVYYDHSIYVFGGQTNNGQIVSTVEQLDISTALNADPHTIAENFRLNQNYPNPFNSATTISFKIGKTCRVRVDVFSILGKHITTLINRKKTAGSYQVSWNGLDKNRKPVGSGIYIYKLVTDYSSDSKKMILVK